MRYMIWKPYNLSKVMQLIGLQFIYSLNKNVISNEKLLVCKNKDKNNKISYEDSYLDVKNKIILEKQSAKPIVKDNLSSAWLTYKPEDEINEKFIGNSAYRGRKGIEPCELKVFI